MYTLVLVGGTGQRLGLTLGYLNVLGIAGMPDRVVIVDAEGTANDETNLVAARTRELLQFGSTQRHVDLFSPYRRPPSGADLTIDQCLDVSGSYLYPLCITEAEEEMSVERGFFANPKLASLVCRAWLNREGAAALRGLAAAAGRVVVIGSVAGGTGAGVIREIARCFHDRSNPRVIGIVFTRYFDLPAPKSPDDPTSEDLDTNARLGCDFLRRDNESPFDILALIGPPPGEPMVIATDARDGVPHRFPGFALAASLLTDGGNALWAQYNEYVDKTPAAQRERFVVAFGGRAGGERLKELDIQFPISHGQGYVSLAAARDASECAEGAISEWVRFPFEKAAGLASLFVRQKLDPNVFDTLKGGRSKLQRSALAQFSDELARAGASATTALQSFREWLGGMHAVNLERLEANADGVRRRSWWGAVQRDDAQAGSHPYSAFAQAWCRQVSRRQWSTSASPQRLGGVSTWMFPYALGQQSPPAGSWSRYSANVAIGQVRDRSYPTPFGPAEAFAQSLLQEPEGNVSIGRAETLWLALAVGWLEVCVVDLAAAPAEFDRVAAEMSPESRFTGLLRLAAKDALPVELGQFAGRLVGATHPACGLWPGIRKDVEPVLTAIGRTLGPESRQRGASVLLAWRQHLRNALPHPGGSLPGWERLVSNIAATAEEAMPAEHVRTRGPCLLEVNGRREVVYLFSWDSNRAAKVDYLLSECADPSVTIAHGPVHVGRNGRARLNLQPVLKEGVVDAIASVKAGLFDLDDETIPVVRVPPPAASTDAGRRRLSVSPHIVQALAEVGLEPQTLTGAPSVRLPDLLWARRPNWAKPIVHNLPVELPVPNPPDQPFPVSNVPNAPTVPGIYYHPGRGRWVLWLKDNLYNPRGAIERLAPTLVRVTDRDGAVQKITVPENALLLNPGAILTTKVYAFATKNGALRPTLPVAAEWMDLVECHDDPPPPVLNAQGAWEYEVPLVGGLVAPFSLPESAFVVEDRLNLAVWPNVESSAWRRYWFGVESNITSELAHLTFATFTRSPWGYYAEQHTQRGVSNFSVLGRPRLVWAGAGDDGGGFVVFANGGTPEIGEKPRRSIVAVDFGTFRSTVVVDTTLNRGAWPASGFRARGRAVIDNPDAVKSYRVQADLFPATASLEPPNHGAGQTTTAEIFFSSLVFPSGREPNERSVPFQDYSIPHRNLLEGLAEYPNSLQGAREGLKWALGAQATQWRVAYLKALLAIGAAESFHLGATLINLRYSFPLSYSAADRLNEAFKEATRWLRAEVIAEATGRVAVEAQTVHSESAAGIEVADPFGDWVLSLDLGGGSLDLGLFATREERRCALAWDSVKLGGDLVTSAYCARTRQSDERHVRDVKYSIANGELAVDEGLRRDASRLLSLAFEYACRFVAGMAGIDAASSPMRLAVVLLGSGWRWWALVPKDANGSFDAVTLREVWEPRIARRLEDLAPGRFRKPEISTAALEGGGEKLAVGTGLAWLDPEQVGNGAAIRSPNGIAESGHPWHRLVTRGEILGRPSDIEPQPPFPADLDKVAPLDLRTHGNAVLARLERCTTDGARSRTALGILFETLSEKAWFSS